MIPCVAPFIWFGGKRRVAPLVWDALGDVDNYVEPFLGSAAVLLARPARHRRVAETVNDADHFLANFWRALAAAPEAVARWADWPVNEDDLFARHLWLVNDGRVRLAAGIERDPEWYDPQVAGWWVWGLNSWIGSGWCAGTGPWTHETVEDGGKRPHLGTAGQGINRQLPHLGDAGQGINRKRPHLGDAGQGINRQLPHLGDAWRGDSVLPVNKGLIEYFGRLATRLRGVRVCSGDWSRVVTDGALAYGASVGVFLDPPYRADVRTADLYATDHADLSTACREWALAHGEDRRLRIVLAGYEPEHGDAMRTAGWRVHAYTASAAYQTAAQTNGTSGNQANRTLERLWFSPGCVVRQGVLL
jgi:site-specific DNA-adenine methylase